MILDWLQTGKEIRDGIDEFLREDMSEDPICIEEFK